MLIYLPTSRTPTALCRGDPTARRRGKLHRQVVPRDRYGALYLYVFLGYTVVVHPEAN